MGNTKSSTRNRATRSKPTISSGSRKVSFEQRQSHSGQYSYGSGTRAECRYDSGASLSAGNVGGAVFRDTARVLEADRSDHRRGRIAGGAGLQASAQALH